MATPVIPVEDLIVVLSDGRVAAAQPVYVVPDSDPVQDAAGRWVQPTAIYFSDGAAPSQSLTLSNNSIAENSPPDTLIGAFTVGGEVDGWAFVISLNDPTIKLITNGLYTTETPLDYETTPNPGFRITATKSNPFIEIIKDFNLQVTNLPEIPDLTPLIFSATGPYDLDVAPGTVLTEISNLEDADDITIVPDDGTVVLNAEKTAILRGLAAWTSGPRSYNVLKYLAGAPNSPLATDWDIDIISNAELVPLLEPGPYAFGEWAADSWPAAPAPIQGVPGTFGYDARAKAAWLDPINETAEGETIFYIGVQAYQQISLAQYALRSPYAGIKEVRFSIDGGPETVVTAVSISPRTGQEGYIVGVKAADWPAARKCEVRCEVVPHVGRPFILQGFPNPMTSGETTPGGYVRLNTVHEMWSLRLNVDPTGSALPRAKVYKAPTASALGNDANDGLTAATPLKTWTATLDKIRAIHGTNDVGGATIYLTASLEHDFGRTDFTGAAGRPTQAQIARAADRWLVVTRDPATTRAQVKITTGTMYGIACEKLTVKGVEASATISNGDPGNLTSTNYYDTKFEDWVFNGGPENVFPISGLPTGPRAAQLANGYSYLINSDISYSIYCGFAELVHCERTHLHHLGPNGDVFNNLKVLDAVEFSYTEDLLDDGPGGEDNGQHVDLYQGINDRRMIVHRDFVAVNNIKNQAHFSDRPSTTSEIAIIRPRINNGGTGYYAYANQSTRGSRDLFMWDPEIIGTINLYVDPPRLIPVGLAQQIDAYANQIVYLGGWEKESGVPSTGKFPGKYGFVELHPWTTEELVDPQPAEHPVQAIVPESGVMGIFDTKLLGRLNVTYNEALSAPEVISWENNSNYLWSWIDAETWQYVEGSTRLYSSTGHAPPTLRDDALWGKVIAFNGINAGAGTGSGLTSGNAGWPVEFRVTGANDECEVHLVLDQEEPASQVTTRTIWAVGGTASNGFGSMDLKVTSNGTKKSLLFRCATAAAGATVGTISKTINTLTALPEALSFEGRMRIRLEKRAASIRMTIWNAQYPDGVTLTTEFDPGFVATLNGARMNFGGNTVNAGGASGAWPKMRLAAYLILRAQYGDPTKETALLAAMAERFTITA